MSLATMFARTGVEYVYKVCFCFPPAPKTHQHAADTTRAWGYEWGAGPPIVPFLTPYASTWPIAGSNAHQSAET